jgi:integrase
MRTGELIALTWEDYSDGYLSVSKARVRGEVTTTKTDDNRSVAIPEKVCAVLNELPSRFRQAEIFTNQYGRHYQAGYHLNKKFRAAHEATGIRHRTGPYPWRHTYASIGLTNGLDHAWLAKQLGHSLQMFYGVYAKWIDTSKRDREELAKLV